MATQLELLNKAASLPVGDPERRAILTAALRMKLRFYPGLPKSYQPEQEIVEPTLKQVLAEAIKRAGLKGRFRGTDWRPEVTIFLDCGTLLSLHLEVSNPATYLWIFGLNLMGAKRQLYAIEIPTHDRSNADDKMIHWHTKANFRNPVLTKNDPRLKKTMKGVRDFAHEVEEYLRHVSSRCAVALSSAMTADEQATQGDEDAAQRRRDESLFMMLSR